mmetsp:Transcript_6448/g.19056  ORF Transcript_6448/g.19056 Transcript_6448/m.19056 type:complete len:234 (-) Transcript_6448:333-1034(-)
MQLGPRLVGPAADAHGQQRVLPPGAKAVDAQLRRGHGVARLAQPALHDIPAPLLPEPAPRVAVALARPLQRLDLRPICVVRLDFREDLFVPIVLHGAISRELVVGGVRKGQHALQEGGAPGRVALCAGLHGTSQVPPPQGAEHVLEQPLLVLEVREVEQPGSLQRPVGVQVRARLQRGRQRTLQLQRPSGALEAPIADAIFRLVLRLASRPRVRPAEPPKHAGQHAQAAAFEV